MMGGAMADEKYAAPVDIDALTKQAQSSLEQARQKYDRFSKTRGKHSRNEGIVEKPNDDHLGELHERQKGKG